MVFFSEDTRTRWWQVLMKLSMARHATGGYRVVRLGGRVIIALPADSLRLRLIGLEYYYPFTARRRLFCALVRLAVLMRLDGLLSSWQASPLPAEDDFGFNEWLVTLRDQLGERDLKATVLWPKDR